MMNRVGSPASSNIMPCCLTIYIDNLSMTEWKGFYMFDEQQYPMTFTFLLLNSAAAEGTINGQGSDEVGAFILQGITKNQAGQLKCTFVKQYLGAHVIYYSGYFNVDQSELQGYWGWEEGSSVAPFKLYK